MIALIEYLLFFTILTQSKIIDFENDVGGVPDDDSDQAHWKNGQIMNETLNLIQPYDTLIIPNKTFHIMGGIQAHHLKHIIIKIEGTLEFSKQIKQWPYDQQGSVLDCIYISNSQNVTITSSGTGIMNGNGWRWWGIPFIGYLLRTENRPKMLVISDSNDILIENLNFISSPYWTVWIPNVDGLEIRNVEISNRRTNWDAHSIIDLSAFNTDGIDVTGKNVYVHDCKIWNQDDCIAVKDGSENMLFERIEASGLGLTIGSIGGSTVRNITFRDCHMHKTSKGIYMKFRQQSDQDNKGYIQDILYENIYMDEPQDWPIWIGPAQQSDSDRLCAAHPCSICWPLIPGSKCQIFNSTNFQNITLRNVTLNKPKKQLGMIMGNDQSPIKGLIFDNVRVIDPQRSNFYRCEGVSNGIALGSTYPIPFCFNQQQI